MTSRNSRTGRPIWLKEDGRTVQIIDQRLLPYEEKIVDLVTVNDVIEAIRQMLVRGAPLIGATGAFGAFLAARNAGAGNFTTEFNRECDRLQKARPTAVNLAWGVDRIRRVVKTAGTPADSVAAARQEALTIADEEAENCRKIGQYGLPLIEGIRATKKSGPVNILTHCNAGWLACIEYGTATAPIYAAFDNRIDIHVWVDETRPLNQGARLTAWELGRYGIPHTVITDNAGGHLMQHGLVDMVIVGTDRTTYTGDVANKIGTYLKALAARDNGIPFYVALPSSTFDWETEDGLGQIPIEERDPDEVRFIQGLSSNGLETIRLVPEDSPAANYAFDVTPARLVTGFITERGVCRADKDSVWSLFPEKQNR
ncbi:MAG: S-methyl-5-thioribose-1-phosphate isomerase [Desulfosudaceae bacterium]